MYIVWFLEHVHQAHHLCCIFLHHPHLSQPNQCKHASESVIATTINKTQQKNRRQQRMQVNSPFLPIIASAMGAGVMGASVMRGSRERSGCEGCTWGSLVCWIMSHIRYHDEWTSEGGKHSQSLILTYNAMPPISHNFIQHVSEDPISSLCTQKDDGQMRG